MIEENLKSQALNLNDKSAIIFTNIINKKKEQFFGKGNKFIHQHN